MTLDHAREAVKRGAALLDEKGPADWRSQIDLDALDMERGHLCILGQLYRRHDDDMNGYMIGVRKLFPTVIDSRSVSGVHGYHSLSHSHSLGELRLAWRELLESAADTRAEAESVDAFIERWGGKLEDMYTRRTAGDHSFTGFVAALMLDLHKREGVQIF
jgi:hypothetical protein